MCARSNVTGCSAPHAAQRRFPSPMDIGLQVLMVRLMAHPIEAHRRCGAAPPRSLHSALLMHLPAGPLSEVQAHRECACSDLGGERSQTAPLQKPPRWRTICTCSGTSCPNLLAPPMRTQAQRHPWPHRYMSRPITFRATSSAVRMARAPPPAPLTVRGPPSPLAAISPHWPGCTSSAGVRRCVSPGWRSRDWESRGIRALVSGLWSRASSFVGKRGSCILGMAGWGWGREVRILAMRGRGW